MSKKRVLTGITTTGIPHLGNYVGAIRPAIQATQNRDDDAFLFLADYHGIIKCHDPEHIHESTLAIAATWLACGLDPEQVTFYRQSDIPEIPELTWVFDCVCAKGLMNRAHAYKAAVDANNAEGNTDPDHGISMGLFSYPVLMAADILMFNATHIPVGRDQIQHVEMARDIAGRFNHRYRDIFVSPEAVVDDNVALLTGLDGRKMSKSYGNTIPLFETEKKLRKAIMKIVTNSQEPGEPKNPDESTVFDIYRAFANAEQIAEMRQRYADGIAWGEAKQALFELINAELAPHRERYHELMENPAEIEAILKHGAEKAREESRARIAEVREAIGIRRLG
ncbi:tryptophan--tRNA ligase [Cardiobacteriaceae bacterium TAE3-ERU3]|nr:tryptophan--tRNA ligase [Cardiobacteriaceae bacterium TAE3-ERU3]